MEVPKMAFQRSLDAG